MANDGLPGFELREAAKAADRRVIDRSVVVPAESGGGIPPVSDQNFVLWVAAAADEIAPWGRAPKLRDAQLRAFFPTENYLLSATSSVCAANAAFNWKLEGPDRLVEQYQEILLNSNRGEGWEDLVTKVSVDLYTQDCGAFVELIRLQDNETSPVINVAHLDAGRCFMTGDPMVPVVYRDRKNALHALKWYQVIHLREMPAPNEHSVAGAFYTLQFCAVTRLLRAAQILKNIGIYKDEKTAGRFNRALILLRGVSRGQIEDALREQTARVDAAGQMRYLNPLMVSSIDPKAEVGHDLIELASLPDAFDEEVTMKWYIAAIAAAFLRDYQDFAPLPGGGLGTSAQSTVLHMKSRGKGPALWQKIWSHMFNFRGVLPQSVTFTWDEQDVDADKQQAELEQARAEGRAARIASGELDDEAARQIAVDMGDLEQEIYEGIVQRREDERQETEKREREQARLSVDAPDTRRHGAPVDSGPADSDITARDDARTKGRWPRGRTKVEEQVEDDLEGLLSGVYDRISKRLEEHHEPAPAETKARARAKKRVVEEQKVIRGADKRIERVVTTREE